jgi:hypothetical protein
VIIAFDCKKSYIVVITCDLSSASHHAHRRVHMQMLSSSYADHANAFILLRISCRLPYEIVLPMLREGDRDVFRSEAKDVSDRSSTAGRLGNSFDLPCFARLLMQRLPELEPIIRAPATVDFHHRCRSLDMCRERRLRHRCRPSDPGMTTQPRVHRYARVSWSP